MDWWENVNRKTPYLMGKPMLPGFGFFLPTKPIGRGLIGLMLLFPPMILSLAMASMVNSILVYLEVYLK